MPADETLSVLLSSILWTINGRYPHADLKSSAPRTLANKGKCAPIMTSPPTALYWFRQDLRLDDLPALHAAASTGKPLFACYVLDDTTPGRYAQGAASRWWLHHSLHALAQAIDALGGRLLLRRGNSADVIVSLVEETGADAVFCSRAYTPWDSKLETTLHTQLAEQGVTFKRFAGSLLFEPESIRTGGDTPFRVYTPFWKSCRRQSTPKPPVALAEKPAFANIAVQSLSLDDLELLPRQPNWAASWPDYWQPGSAGAHAALSRFLEGSIDNYAQGRDVPSLQATSLLSPHLHFGEISPRQVWHKVIDYCADHPQLDGNREKFLSELGWREFNHHLLTHYPHICDSPFNPRFAEFPWMGSEDQLRAWQKGATGYPIVDAGMRQLWQTGYMHNRVRMICASFLTKHLLIPWQEGERWFWDTLVDADLANNLNGWQWTAGCGADAAPYFRIFNPTLQGKKFDAQGDYVRRWVPELARLPDRHLHEPAAAPPEVLEAAGVKLGASYPLPIVEHRAAREAALAAYALIKQRE